MSSYQDYYIYILLDCSKTTECVYGTFSFAHEPFYVGKGRSKRIKDTLYDKSPFKKRKIDKLKSEGVEILAFKLFESLTNDEAIEIERYLISLIGRRDDLKGPLVNLTDGGEGRLNSPHTEEVKSKISEAKKGKGVGRKHSQETIELMKQKQAGENNGFWNKKHTDAVKKEQSERVGGLNHPMWEKKHKEETIDKLIKHRKEKISNDKIKKACQKFNKVVMMYDLEFNFLKEFESVKEASLVTGINASIISKNCRGEIKKPTRFHFRYKNLKDRTKNNKFKISVGDIYEKDGKKWRLVKRNTKTCICESGGVAQTLHIKDNSFLFEKDQIRDHT